MSKTINLFETSSDGSLEKLAKSIEKRKKTIVSNIIAVGGELKKARELLSHRGNGTFGKWCESRLGIPRRTAHNYMLAHDTGVCATVAQTITPTALYQLGKTMDTAPKAIETVEELTKQGVKVTEPIAKAIINHELAGVDDGELKKALINHDPNWQEDHEVIIEKPAKKWEPMTLSEATFALLKVKNRAPAGLTSCAVKHIKKMLDGILEEIESDESNPLPGALLDMTINDALEVVSKPKTTVEIIDQKPAKALPIAEKPETKPAQPSKPKFNRTNENVDWARWTWNPVTGCLHNCVYCYARDIANRFYKEGFEPTFRPERLSAPQNTKLPREAAEDVREKNVFVCSMADLFGKWVPDEWIEAVMAEVRKAPQWNFLFLSKFPQRFESIDWPANSWIGASVDEQSKVSIAEKAFRKVKGPYIKWLSVEPLRERLTFSSLEMFDYIVIGGQSKSTGAPAMQPEWDWVLDLLNQARESGCKVYWKANLETPRMLP